MSDAIRAIGAQLKIGAGGTVISEVLDINGPGLTTDLIDVSNQDSTGDFREWLVGFRDGGEFTFDINYNPVEATHKNAAGGLLFIWESGAIQAFDLVMPDVGATTWQFNAFVTNFAVTMNLNEQLKASVTLRLSGKPTLV